MADYHSCSVLAVDFETKGTDPFLPSNRIVGVGLSDGVHADYFEYTKENKQEIMELLLGKSLIVFNAVFECGWICAETGQFPDIEMDTAAAFWSLASEGWTGQEHTLKIAMTSILGWEDPNNIRLNAWLAENKLGKADMWQAPPEILGPYCALDAGATFHLRDYFLTVLEQFPALADYLATDMMNLVELVVEQRARGFAVNEAGMLSHYESLTEEVRAMEDEILQTEEVVECNKILQERELQAVRKKEPNQHTKTGEVSKLWERWLDKQEIIKNTMFFNIRSVKHKQYLFFEHLKYTPIKKTDTGYSTDKECLPHFGKIGQMLLKYNKKNKELGYVKAAVSQIRDGLIHHNLKVPGTVTNRCAGSDGFNLQQQPKVAGYMENMCARPGHKWIQLDFAAMEPKVQAMFSRDENMMKLYGPDATPNDVYLFVGSHMTEVPGIGDEIRKYYDPENPTPESISLAKKECKGIRYVCKRFTLAADYGAYPNRLYQTLLTEGITNINKAQVTQMWLSFWQTFAGKQEFMERLKYEWQTRGGYIMNARGRPLTVDDSMTKDLLNRFAQSTGHDILMAYLTILNRKRKELDIDFWPVIVDFHDETIWESREEDAPAVAKLMEESMEELNNLLGWDINMNGEPEIVSNLAVVKCPDDYKETA